MLFHTAGFGLAREELLRLLSSDIPAAARSEVLALLFRVNAERDDSREIQDIHDQSAEVKKQCLEGRFLAALYQLGIVFLLSDDPDQSEECFSECARLAAVPEDLALCEYGLAAVKHNRKQSVDAVTCLDRLSSPEAVTGSSADFQCLVHLLKGNCLKGLGRHEDAMGAYLQAQRHLPTARTFYLKNWVFFGLATAHARRGDSASAKTLLEVVLSITHPSDFRRLHKLASDELSRLETRVDVYFDPVRGDVVSNRGYLSLRRKPILIGLFRQLADHWPRTVTKEGLYQGVWGGEYHPLRHDGLIYSHVQRLRQLLASDAKLTEFLVTLPDGYGLSPEVSVRVKDSNQEIKARVGGSPREAQYEL